MKEGQISLVPIDPSLGRPEWATISNGEYHIDAAVAGEYQVQIYAFRKTGKKVWDGMGDEKAPASKKNYVEEVEAFIPTKYNDATELRATIKAGQVNVYDFPLKLDGKK